MNKNFLIILIVIFLAVVVFLYIDEKRETVEPSLTFGEVEELNTKYISQVVWPPEITLSEGLELVCNETPMESSVAKRVYKETFNGQEYCITVSSEGAAGSIYTEYSYSTIKFNKLITLDFILRFVNCSNYDEEEQTACITERESFNPTSYIDKIISNVEYISK